MSKQTNKTILLLIGMLFFGSNIVFAQKSPADYKMLSCQSVEKATDASNAINVAKAQEIKLSCSPMGAGSTLEAESGKKIDNYYFEKEHNVIWIKFTARMNGYLNMRIVPDSILDDYDFLLFKSTSEDDLSQIKKKKKKAIRSNIARNSNTQDGKTGLDFFSTKSFVTSGPNEQFSKSPEVKINEVYYLAIDNVYDNGGGATIYLDYFQSKEIKGTVVDEDNNIVPNAEVTWEDVNTGEILSSTKSDSVTGKFAMVVLYDINPSNEYVLTSFSQKHFFSEISYSPSEIHACDPENIQLVMPELKKGVKGKINNIHFPGDQYTFLVSAYPSLKRLEKLMKNNDRLSILIEGHTNGCTGGVKHSQELSENRASAVKNYLIKAGISASRLTTKGYNCTQMLYAYDAAPRFQRMNRRVEILITDY